MSKELILDIEQNAEGQKLAVLATVDNNGNPDSGYRIAGPKAWGGSHNIARLRLTTDDLTSFIKGYVPDLVNSGMVESKNEISLYNGDALKILPESKEFEFKCCDCGLIHLVKIERDGENILLSFYRE